MSWRETQQWMKVKHLKRQKVKQTNEILFKINELLKTYFQALVPIGNFGLFRILKQQ